MGSISYSPSYLLWCNSSMQANCSLQEPSACAQRRHACLSPRSKVNTPHRHAYTGNHLIVKARPSLFACTLVSDKRLVQTNKRSEVKMDKSSLLPNDQPPLPLCGEARRRVRHTCVFLALRFCVTTILIVLLLLGLYCLMQSVVVTSNV